MAMLFAAPKPDDNDLSYDEVLTKVVQLAQEVEILHLELIKKIQDMRWYHRIWFVLRGIKMFGPV